MNQEAPTQTQAAPSQEGIQPGLAARAEAMGDIAKARENLAHVAVGHEVHADSSGVVMTPREVAEQRAVGTHDEVRI